MIAGVCWPALCSIEGGKSSSGWARTGSWLVLAGEERPRRSIVHTGTHNTRTQTHLQANVMLQSKMKLVWGKKVQNLANQFIPEALNIARGNTPQGLPC